MIDVQLTTPLYGGETLGRLPDGRAVFVPWGMPGEVVRIELVEEKRNFARAALVEVIVPAPERIEPRCRHFGICGGCQYQHINYETQLNLKTQVLRDQLQRIGGISAPPVEPMIPCPQPFYYRNHVQFHLTAGGELGFYRSDGESLFAVEECHLPEEVINEVWPQLTFEPLPEIERIGLRAGSDDDVLLVMESLALETPEVSVEDLPISAVHKIPEQTIVIAGREYVVIQVKERDFRVSAGSFFQVNTPMAEKMVQALLEELPLTENTTALDVYCGAGLFSAFLAERCAQVIGVEVNPGAAEDFVVNLDDFDNVSLYEAEAEVALPALAMEGVRPDIVVVDPPRAGMERQALDALIELRASTLAYFSCDPATLARDAKRLTKSGYQLEKVIPFDLFPQTYHIESLSLWRVNPDPPQA
ncbi:MAG TPA: class I SAM-dependent RNA methyltransferase [Anaerolineales bacterium]|nr:class I SAM-dependent RNA methyltransferase [Anaerolineales bacterium]